MRAMDLASVAGGDDALGFGFFDAAAAGGPVVDEDVEFFAGVVFEDGVEDVAGFAPFQGDLVGVGFEQGEAAPVEEHGGIDAAGVGGIHMDDAVALVGQAIDQVAQDVFVFDLLDAEDVGALAVVHAEMTWARLSSLVS
jgi:hypothetical protein